MSVPPLCFTTTSENSSCTEQPVVSRDFADYVTSTEQTSTTKPPVVWVPYLGLFFMVIVSIVLIISFYNHRLRVIKRRQAALDYEELDIDLNRKRLHGIMHAPIRPEDLIKRTIEEDRTTMQTVTNGLRIQPLHFNKHILNSTCSECGVMPRRVYHHAHTRRVVCTHEDNCVQKQALAAANPHPHCCCCARPKNSDPHSVPGRFIPQPPAVVRNEDEAPQNMTYFSKEHRQLMKQKRLPVKNADTNVSFPSRDLLYQVDESSAGNESQSENGSNNGAKASSRPDVYVERSDFDQIGTLKSGSLTSMKTSRSNSFGSEASTKPSLTTDTVDIANTECSPSKVRLVNVERSALAIRRSQAKLYANGDQNDSSIATSTRNHYANGSDKKDEFRYEYPVNVTGIPSTSVNNSDDDNTVVRTPVQKLPSYFTSSTSQETSCLHPELRDDNPRGHINFGYSADSMDAASTVTLPQQLLNDQYFQLVQPMAKPDAYPLISSFHSEHDQEHEQHSDVDITQTTERSSRNSSKQLRNSSSSKENTQGHQNHELLAFSRKQHDEIHRTGKVTSPVSSNNPQVIETGIIAPSPPKLKRVTPKVLSTQSANTPKSLGFSRQVNQIMSASVGKKRWKLSSLKNRPIVRQSSTSADASPSQDTNIFYLTPTEPQSLGDQNV